MLDERRLDESFAMVLSDRLSEMIRGRASGYSSFARLARCTPHPLPSIDSAYLPVNHRPTRTIQKRLIEVVERPARDSSTADIAVHARVLVRSHRLNDMPSSTSSTASRSNVIPDDPPSTTHGTVRRWAQGHPPLQCRKHHERQSPIPVQRMAVEVVDRRFWRSQSSITR